MKGKRLLLASSLTVGLLAACSPTEKEWTVSFDVASIASQTVKDGETATKPADPSKESTAKYDYAFEYWAKDGKEYDFSSPVHSSFTLSAVWKEEIRKYHVTFLSEDGATTLYESEYSYGDTPVYGGEDISKESSDEYDYVLTWSPVITTVTKDATYTATYTATKRKYAVTFDSDGGSEVSIQNVEYGAKATEPSKPTKSKSYGDYEFLGWYLGDEKYDFDSEIKSPITLKAKWGNVYKNAVKNADGTITISRMERTGDQSEGYGAKAAYVAIEGDYGVGNSLAFDFTGKNIPNIGLFASAIGGPVDGTEGMYVSSGVTDNTLLGRLTIYGNHLLDSGNPSDYTTYNALGYNDRLETETESDFGLNNLSDDKDYRYKVTTKEATSGVELILELEEVLSNGSTLGLASFDKVISGYTGPRSGNIIVYGTFKSDITLKMHDLNENIPSPDIVAHKAEMTGNTITLNSGTRQDDSYVGLNAGVGVGDKIEVSYVGKNIPNIAFLCDTNKGQMIGGGQGVYLANSFIINFATDTTNTKRMTPYGPYRWSNVGQGGGWDTRCRNTSGIDSKLGYANMEDGMNYVFTITIDSLVEDTVVFTIELVNNDTKATVTNRTITMSGLSGLLVNGDTLNLGENVIFYGHEKSVTFNYKFVYAQEEQGE